MAKKLINRKEISDEDWLSLRKKSLGGSDASKVIGVNPFASPLSLYVEKLDISSPKETKSHGALWLGKRLEDDIALLYEEVEGKKTRKDNIMWVDDEYLCGELRAKEMQRHTFHIHAEDEYFSRERPRVGDGTSGMEGVIYRNGKVYRDVIDRTTGRCVESQLIRTNHARVMYECPPSIVIQDK